MKKATSMPQMSKTLGKGSLNKAAKTSGRVGGPGKLGARAMGKGLKKKGKGLNPFASTLGNLNG